VTDTLDPVEPFTPSGPPKPSRAIGFSNWLVSRATGLLEKRASRRGFLVGSAMAGSAVAVAGCNFATQPGSSYSRITDCGPGSACTDGYTEFCCTINDGVNTCPPDSFAGGWWRADFSTFCNGTRYYIDCMQYCCGPPTGYQNFCSGCSECRCGGDCNTRKVYCNYFRYGQCHQEIVQSGPIACRVVSCVPPYQSDPACSPASAVDNATAQHSSPCLSALPRSTQLPDAATAFESPLYALTVVARSANGDLVSRTLNGSGWSPLQAVGLGVTSGITSVVGASGAYVLGRSLGDALWYNRFVDGRWTGVGAFGGIPLTSDPVAVATGPNQFHVFVRSHAGNSWYARNDDGTWAGWFPLEGAATSNLAAAANQMGVFVFVRGPDGGLYYRHGVNGNFSGWVGLGGVGISDPSACADAGGVHVFMRQAGRSIWHRRFDGSSWSGWQSLGGSVAGDPNAITAPGGPHVFVRGSDGSAWCNKSFFGNWSGFQPMSGGLTTNPIGYATAGGDVYGFCTGGDNALWWGRYYGSAWSVWQSLGGDLRPMTAA
jgi:hypothetical protein